MMRAVLSIMPTMNPLLALTLAGAGVVAHAQTPTASAPASRPDLPLWEFGIAAGTISQQAYPGADEQVRRTPVLPYLVYRGEVLRADDDGAGLRAVHTDSFELDVSFAGALGPGGKTVKAREGMPRLGSLIEFGPVARWFLNGRRATDRVSIELPVRGVFEARDLRRHRGMSVEPEVSLDHRARGGWNYGLSAGVLFGDRRLGSTYYGVSAADALPDRPAYAARAGLVAWRLKAGVSRQVSPDVRLFAFGRLDSVSGAANADSPLVRRTTGASIGIGLTYTLQRSGARAAD